MHFDVVIVGGGPAGAVAGLTLAQASRRVCIVERRPATFRIGESLHPAARPLLRDLGLLDAFLKEGHGEYLGNVSLWGSSETSHHDFLRDPNGRGWHLDRARFDEFLRREPQRSGCVVWEHVTREEVTREQKGRIVLQMAGRFAEEVTCDFVIDATGQAAGIGRRLGAERVRDDRLLCIFAIFRATGAIDDLAYTLCESTAEGWWYSSRLPSGQRIVAFHTDADLLQASRGRTLDGFLQSLQETSLLGVQMASHDYEAETPPVTVSAESSQLWPVGGKGWFATGDTACAFDPVSSQGILNALLTGMRAGEAVRDWLDGRSAALDEYQAAMATIYERYQLHKRQYYLAETRWHAETFWSRRHLTNG